jgi:integrase
LFAHRSGQWAKKIRGRLRYFGKWDDPWGALERYQQQKDDLHAGREPRATGGTEVRDVVNHFLTAKRRKVEAGELKQVTFDSYYQAAQRMVKSMNPRRTATDVGPDDFAKLREQFTRDYSPGEVGKQVQMVRSIWKHAFDAGLIDRPVRFGPEFTRPSQKTIRQHKRQRPSRLIEPDELRTLIDNADTPLKAMILLGINAGWGQSDIAELPIEALDLANDVADHPRPKTGVERRVVLWPQTVRAVREALQNRPEPTHSDDEGLAFITAHGRRWVRYKGRSDDKAHSSTDAIALRFTQLAKRLGIKRPGLAFYSLRVTFRTVADECGDRPAIDRIMGHEPTNDMATHYRERISDERLRRVTDHVRQWLGLEDESEQADVAGRIGKAG